MIVDYSNHHLNYSVILNEQERIGLKDKLPQEPFPIIEGPLLLNGVPYTDGRRFVVRASVNLRPRKCEGAPEYQRSGGIDLDRIKDEEDKENVRISLSLGGVLDRLLFEDGRKISEMCPISGNGVKREVTVYLE